MKNIIAIFGVVALMAGMGASNASAENFFKKLGRSVRNAHERHEDMLEALHNSRPRVVIREANRGHYENREVRTWVAGYTTTQYVEVRTAGHYEIRQIVEIVTPASCQGDVPASVENEVAALRPIHRIGQPNSRRSRREEDSPEGAIEATDSCLRS